MAFPIQCQKCGATGEVLRVTAGLQCRCGSTDLDLYDGPKTAGYSGPDYGDDRDKNRYDVQGSPSDDEEAGLYHGVNGIEPYSFGNDTPYMRKYREGREMRQAHTSALEDLNQEDREQAVGWAHGHRGLDPQYDSANYRRGHELGKANRAQVNKRTSTITTSSPTFTGTFTAASGGSGWFEQRPDPLTNWNEYAGPTPGGNEDVGHKVDSDETTTCPICNGTGSDPRASGGGYEENVCRNCHGTGKIVSPTGQPAEQSLDAHKPGPVPLGGGWQGKQSAKITVNGKEYDATIRVTSKVDKIAAKILQTNSGLNREEAYVLARRAVNRYPEGRE